MKLIEKLAEDHAPPIGRSHAFQIDQWNAQIHWACKTAYMAGFRKAREMAIQVAINKAEDDFQDARSISEKNEYWTGSGDGALALAEIIEDIGEQEAE